MSRTAITVTSLLIVLCALSAVAQDPAVLEVRGRGVEGRPPYRGGGVVKFLDAAVEAQVVHYDGGKDLSLPLRIDYEVLKPAPVMLTSRLGTEYWRLCHFQTEAMAAMYADEKIDLSRAGKQTTEATRAWFGSQYGPLPKGGLVGIRGHYYFLIDQADGPWIDVTDPSPFFDQRQVGRKLTFTLADLSDSAMSISEVQSTWESGGPFRLKLAVTDAGGRTYPVVNAPITATAGPWRAELTTEWGPLSEPTGWMRASLPEQVPEKILIQGTVTLQAPRGLTRRDVSGTFQRGEGRVGAEEFKIAVQGYQLPRDEEGRIRETRAIWISPTDIESSEGIDGLVERAGQAGLNVLIPDVFVRNRLVARSDLMPSAGTAKEDFDPLGSLIQKAHAAGLEVHPWFCVTYRDRAFRAWFDEKHGSSIDMIDRDGKAIDLGADVHRPEYRQFMVDLMVGVARDYEVEGIHLDYIRSMGQCFCEACRAEFAKEFGKPLTDASEEDWIAWQRQAIGDIVRRTAEGVRQVRPGALMSAAVFANVAGGAAQGQDPAGWARSGWMDLILPMDYQMQTLQVRANQRQFLAALDDDRKLVTGLSLYMRSGAKVMSRPAELVREQIELVRRMGIHGYCLFAYGHLSDEQLRILRRDINAEPAVPFCR